MGRAIAIGGLAGKLSPQIRRASGFFLVQSIGTLNIYTRPKREFLYDFSQLEWPLPLQPQDAVFNLQSPRDKVALNKR
jgi:hypothetical protein